MFAFVVDGVKLFLESFAPYREKDTSGSHEEVSVVIPMHNKAGQIGRVLEAVQRLFPAENIFVVDDRSTDDSLQEARRFGGRATIIALPNNIGKVSAIDAGLARVKTKFVLLLDADVILPSNFRCPTGLLKNGITAASFNVLPIGHTDKRSFLMGLQFYEYLKSMVIGRKFQDHSACVSCVSGAVGLFHTDRLRKLSEKHSGIFTGEDLERTLIELVHEGRVIFVDVRVDTYAPERFSELTRQRVFGWWPGLWRNLPLMSSLIFRRCSPIQLRLEMAYMVFSLLTDPLKIISLAFLLLSGSWQIIGVLYVVYTLMELAAWSRIRAGGYRDVSITIVLAWFFYNLVQMVFRLGGLVALVSGMRRMAKVAILASLCVLAPISASAQEGEETKKPDWVASVAYERIEDSTGRTTDNTNLYIGYKILFAEVNTALAAPRYFNIGAYVPVGKKIIIAPSLMTRMGGRTMRLTAEVPLAGGFVGRVGMDYHHTSDGSVKDFPSLRAGTDYYYGDYHYASVDVIKDTGRFKTTTVVAKNRYQPNPGLAFTLGGAVNDRGDTGWFGKAEMKNFFISYSSFQNFDFARFDRTTITVGAKVKF